MYAHTLLKPPSTLQCIQIEQLNTSCTYMVTEVCPHQNTTKSQPPAFFHITGSQSQKEIGAVEADPLLPSQHRELFCRLRSKLQYEPAPPQHFSNMVCVLCIFRHSLTRPTLLTVLLVLCVKLAFLPCHLLRCNLCRVSFPMTIFGIFTYSTLIHPLVIT